MELDGLTEDSLVLWMQEFLTEGREIDLIKDCDTLATVLFFVMTSLQASAKRLKRITSRSIEILHTANRSIISGSALYSFS